MNSFKQIIGALPCRVSSTSTFVPIGCEHKSSFYCTKYLSSQLPGNIQAVTYSNDVKNSCTLLNVASLQSYALHIPRRDQLCNYNFTIDRTGVFDIIQQDLSTNCNYSTSTKGKDVKFTEKKTEEKSEIYGPTPRTYAQLIAAYSNDMNKKKFDKILNLTGALFSKLPFNSVETPITKNYRRKSKVNKQSLISNTVKHNYLTVNGNDIKVLAETDGIFGDYVHSDYDIINEYDNVKTLSKNHIHRNVSSLTHDDIKLSYSNCLNKSYIIDLLTDETIELEILLNPKLFNDIESILNLQIFVSITPKVMSGNENNNVENNSKTIRSTSTILESPAEKEKFQVEWMSLKSVIKTFSGMRPLKSKALIGKEVLQIDKLVEPKKTVNTGRSQNRPITPGTQRLRKRKKRRSISRIMRHIGEEIQGRIKRKKRTSIDKVKTGMTVSKKNLWDESVTKLSMINKNPLVSSGDEMHKNRLKCIKLDDTGKSPLNEYSNNTINKTYFTSKSPIGSCDKSISSCKQNMKTNIETRITVSHKHIGLLYTARTNKEKMFRSKIIKCCDKNEKYPIDGKPMIKKITEVIKPIEKRKDGTLIDYGLTVPTRKHRNKKKEPGTGRKVTPKKTT